MAAVGARPGLSLQQTDAAGKRLELLREVVAGLGHLAIMANVADPGPRQEMRDIQAMARAIGLAVTTLELRRAEDIAPAFDGLKARAEAL